MNNKYEILWVGGSQAVLLGANFLLLKLMTSQLSVESFGVYSLCMTIVLFSRQLIYDPLSTVIAKKCGSASDSREEIFEGLEIVGFVTGRLLLIFVVLAAIYVLGIRIFFDNSVDSIIIFSCVIYLCANGAQGMYFNVLNIVCYRKQAALFSIFDSLLKLLLVYVSLKYFGVEVVSALVPVSAGAFAVFSCVRRYIRSRFLSDFVPRVSLNSLVKSSLLASVPLYFPTLLGALKSVGDRWILAGYIGVDELAAFTILLQLGYFPMTLLVGIIQTFVAPRVYMLSAAQDAGARSDLRGFLGKLLAALSIFTLIACGVAYVVADEIFIAFVGPKYKTYASFFPVFVVSGAFAAGAGIIQLGAIGLFKTSVVGKLMGATVVISIFCAFSLISVFGFKGASAGLLISSAISALLYGAVIYFGALRPFQSGA